MASALEDLIGEVRLAFHQLKATAELLHQDPDGLTASHRGVLESLHREGPRTVPDLARARPVSRQHIQVLVNRLLQLELVRTVPNPAHRKSPLIELTPAGARRFEAMQRRERRVLQAVARELPEARVRAAADTLSNLRALLR